MLSTLQTNLGDLIFRVSVGENLMQMGILTPVLNSTFSRAEFSSPGARGEFLIGALSTESLSDLDQNVDAYYGVYWRVEALQDLSYFQSVQFACIWDNSAEWETFGKSSGQTVEACHWQSGLKDICIGTQSMDEDTDMGLPFLSLPERWFVKSEQSHREFHGRSVEFSVAGAVITYPALRSGEVCHAYFGIAWKTRRDEEDVDTWFAVDLLPVHIVENIFSAPFTSDTGNTETGA